MTSSSSRRPAAQHASSRRSQAARGAQPAAHAPAGSAVSLIPDSLGFSLDQAAQVVGDVRGGAALPAALAAAFAALPAASVAQSRGAVQDIAYRTMRRLGTVDWLLRTRVSKAPPEHVGNLLACALALLLDDEANAAYAPFTVVDQAVRAIGARREVAFAKGLVNAVLRGFLRERDALLAAAAKDDVARWSYPQWWIDATRAAWPDAWQSILDAGNRQGPLTLRVNARRSTVDAYLERLGAAGIGATRVGERAVRLATALPVDRIPGFAAGDVSVQDAGAQLAAQLLGARDGMRVLDACAAPGGKTGHLLERTDVDLVALESDPARAARIGDNLARLGLSAQVVVGDAATPSAWHDGQPFDRILADVPCSASGIVRRHPDIRWLRRPADIGALVNEQRRIVDALWPLLKPGGELLYVTCSIFPEEGDAQARWFESSHPDAVRLDAPGQLLPTSGGAPAGDTDSGAAADARHDADADASPDSDCAADHDGFFYARFQKR
ncbi:16S rRNA (cytosine(967)-C(5))-methyltransferase RsmB [Paraburkholderia caballeronis]|uniref:16S rRNA (cytosine(967)-C(5))-methyltransferase RsmB n=1 Tax=Paraburkholderia caballeronis TaxID=416943 RepID=UPI0010670A9A|nr:16S rRNA (cytosine(967)-C(5))-methyltransferase RsmB [Paraburkholderia caballeronis]TDV18667.1 16S rRNA (cytosine967-C5)-methyltransferase [Paraburkholderia caballeronis]TDV19795.1 16S rRNA (cytosine967-C5)-methyltransferase [Paraburkholderia caballeronis]TDV28012.1 16S rRNA (cytosine967-C5)-methyltransferase [Paraburkholderia caballeronis]